MRRLKLLTLGLFACFAVAVWTKQVAHVNAQGGLAAPTGLTATDRAYATKVGLRWDTIRGATVYRIFRNTANDTGSAQEVGSTPANYFFDLSAAIEQTYFYW